MEIFFCTFIIKLQYVKRSKESTLKKGVASTFEAILKSSKNYIIASGNSRPSLMNDTAWFNQRFEINSDIVFNPETKSFNQSIITLEIKVTSKVSTTSYSKSFNLAQIAEAKLISQRQYILSGGLAANIELCCSHMESKGLKPLRKREKSEEKKIKQEEISSFLMIQKVSFAGQVQKQAGHDTPQFHQSSFKQIQQAIDLNPLILEDPNTQISELKDQLRKEIKEHQQTKSKLKTIKQLLENEYNVNRQQKIAINRLQKQVQSQKKAYRSLQNQFAEAENECTTLSATVSQKQSEIIQLFTIIQQYKEKIVVAQKKLEYIDPLERSKAQLEWEKGVMKKQAQNLKLMLNKQYLTQNDIKSQLEQLKSQCLKLKTSKEKADEELNKVIKRQKENVITIGKLTQQKDLIKRQTTKWRSQFAVQAQRKDEQINHLTEHYSQLYKRYQQIVKKVENYPNSVTKDTFEASVKTYEKKIEQYEEKQSKFREQLEIIEQQIANMQALLQEKQENQEVLLQHIKKLQKDIDQYAASDNWWASILEKNQAAAQNHQTDPNDQKIKLINKNQQLIQFLQKNSKTILEGEKIKLELNGLKKQNEQLTQKQLLLHDQYKELKQKIGSLYKQNKKLQEKNSKLVKQNELLNKKNLWLEQEITQSKITEKDARQDYEIVSYQLYKIEAAKQAKQKLQSEKPPVFLSVINENSQQFLPSSHHLIKENSTKEKSKNGSEKSIDRAVFQELSKILEQRAIYSQQMHSHLENLKKENFNSSLDTLKEQMKIISLSTSKIKSALVRSGNKQYVKQWQNAILSLSNALQNLIICN